MGIDKHSLLRTLAIGAALFWGAMEAMALQRSRLTQWRLSHRGN